jgi:hypothetical protein
MLDRLSGAKIYMLSATSEAVGVIWGGDPLYWQQVPNHDSRYIQWGDNPKD